MKQRDRLMLLGVLAAVVLVAGWFLALAPRREEAAKLGEQVATQRAARDSSRADVQAGIAAKRKFGRYYATVARLGAAVPDDDNVLSLLVQLQRAAQASDVAFRSLKVGEGSGAATPAPAPPVDPAAPATQAATATLPPGAAVGAAGFPTMPFSFKFDGGFFHLSDFVGRLEHFLVVHNRTLAVSGRFMTIDGISLQAAPQGFPLMAASVAATTYLLPASEGLTDGASVGGPADASGTPAASGSASPTGPATITPASP
jgi:Tfp pilus assembly protein PilO